MTTNDLLFPEKHNIEPGELLSMLQYQQERKLDVTAPGRSVRLIHSEEAGLSTVINTEVGDVVLENRLTFNRQIAERFKIHANYRDVMLNSGPDLFATNCNYWLDKNPRKGYTIRAFTDYPGSEFGFTRAFLSDSYLTIDNLDAITTAMEVIDDLNQRHGYDLEANSCSISDSRMYVTFYSKNVQREIRELRNYRNPGTGQTGNGGLTMGFVIGNSEIGNGSTFVAPLLQVNACNNSIRWMDKDIAWTRAHRGSRRDATVVRWSNETQNKMAVAEISQIKDKVKWFLSPDFMGKRVEEIVAAMQVELDNPVATIANLSDAYKFSDQKKNALLAAFVGGGNRANTWEVIQAATWVAQGENPDEAHETEKLAATFLDNPGLIKKHDREPVSVLN